MRTTVEYLDEIKDRHGLPSDYAIAKKLGLTTQAISRYRHGQSYFDDDACIRVAEALDINPLEVIVSANRERAKNADVRARWESYWENFSANFRSPVLPADARQLSLWPQ